MADGERLRRLGVAADDGDVGLDDDERGLPPGVLDPQLDHLGGARRSEPVARRRRRRRPHPRPRRYQRLEPFGRILGVGEGINLDQNLLGLELEQRRRPPRVAKHRFAHLNLGARAGAGPSVRRRRLPRRGRSGKPLARRAPRRRRAASHWRRHRRQWRRRSRAHSAAASTRRRSTSNRDGRASDAHEAARPRRARAAAPRM